MSGFHEPSSWFPYERAEQNHLRRRLLRLVGEGHARHALRIYEGLKDAILPAATHHAAFVAAREARMSEKYLLSITEAAQKCPDWPGSELDFTRDWAIYFAEVKRDTAEALAAINEVIRSRTDDEGQDRRRVRIDKLAQAKILLMAGEVAESLEILEELKSLTSWRYREDLTQFDRDVHWWHFVVTCMAREYEDAYDLASELHRLNAEPKKVRRAAYRIASIQPWICPRIARLAIRRML